MNMKNLMAAQAGVSIAAIVCLVIGWMQPFSPVINDFIYNKLFYILVGVSFILQAPTLANQKFKIPMYIAAGLCVVGAFLPTETRLAGIKTIGLVAGVIMSLFGRNRSVN